MLKKIEIAARKLLLNILLFFSIKKKPEKIDLKKGDNILIIRLNRIGDALVTTPLIKVLAETGGFNVSVLADAKNKIVFENNPFVKETIVFKKGLAGFRQTIKRLNNLNFKIVIDAHVDVSTTVSFLVASLNAFTLALKKSNAKLYSATLQPLTKEKTHIVERVLRLADYFNLNYSKDNVNIIYKPKEESLTFANKEIQKINPDRKFLLGINISAGSDARFWGVENYKRLIESAEPFDIAIILFCVPWETERAENISEGRIPIFAHKFDELAAEISKLDLLFSPDTSTVHLASAFNVPVFGIYVLYNTTEMPWSPYRSEHELVITREPNFNNLNFEEVKEKFINFLSKFVSLNN